MARVQKGAYAAHVRRRYSVQLYERLQRYNISEAMLAPMNQQQVADTLGIYAQLAH